MVKVHNLSPLLSNIMLNKLEKELEARIIALACGTPPEGYAKWTLRLLADRTVELGYVKDISHVTVSRILKKTNLSLT